MKITVKVTQEGIDAGEKRSCSFCPINRAIERVTGISAATIGPQVYLVGYNNPIILPQIAVDFIDAFAAGQPVQPISFELEVPDV